MMRQAILNSKNNAVLRICLLLFSSLIFSLFITLLIFLATDTKLKQAEADDPTPGVPTTYDFSLYSFPNPDPNVAHEFNLDSDPDGYIFTGDAGDKPIKITCNTFANLPITFSSVTINKFHSLNYSDDTIDSSNKINLEGTNIFNTFTGDGGTGTIIIEKKTKLTIEGTGDSSLYMDSQNPCVSFTNKNSDGSEINIRNTTVTLTNAGFGSVLGLLPGSYMNWSKTLPGKISIEGTTISAFANHGAGLGGGYYCDETQEINIYNCNEIYAQSSNNGSGIGGGANPASAVVTITSVSSITAISGGDCAGLGAGWTNSLGTVNISAVEKITALSNGHGAGIGGGSNHSVGNVSIASASSIYATAKGHGAGIGGGNVGSTATVTISATTYIGAIGGRDAGAGIGGGSVGSQANVTITSATSVCGDAKENGAGVGAATNSFNNNIVITSSKTIPSTFVANNSDLNIGIYGEAKVTGIGGRGAAGIGGATDDANANVGKINIEIGEGVGIDNPKISAVNRALADRDTNAINNTAAIGNGATKKTISSILTTNVKINSGEIHAVDQTLFWASDTTKGAAIGANNNETTPSSIIFNGGDIHMYGNACFYQNPFGAIGYEKGITLSSRASIYIGGGPPVIEAPDGASYQFTVFFPTTIRNFKTYGLKVKMGSKISVDSRAEIFLGNESDYRGQGLKFDVPYAFNDNFDNAIVAVDSVELEKYTLTYEGIFAPEHDGQYGMSLTDDVSTVTSWTSIPAGQNSITYDFLDGNKKYYIFLRLKSDYFAEEIFETHKDGMNMRRIFSVNFFSNEGRGTMSAVKVLENGSLTLPKNSFTRIGYAFKNWNTDESGTGGDTYANGFVFNNYNLRKNLNLYAIWTPNTYKITFNKNGGTGTMKTLSVKTDTKVTLTKNTFKRSGYTFKSWNTKSGGTGTTYKNSYVFTKYNLGANLNLYAIWSKNSSGGTSGGGGSSGTSGSGSGGSGSGDSSGSSGGSSGTSGSGSNASSKSGDGNSWKVSTANNSAFNTSVFFGGRTVLLVTVLILGTFLLLVFLWKRVFKLILRIEVEAEEDAGKNKVLNKPKVLEQVKY